MDNTVVEWVMFIGENQVEDKDDLFALQQTTLLSLVSDIPDPAVAAEFESTVNKMLQELLDNKNVTVEAERTVIIGSFSSFGHDCQRHCVAMTKTSVFLFVFNF